MKKFGQFIVLVVFLSAAWATIPFFVGGRDNETEDRLLGARNFVQEIIEGSYAEARKVDVFNLPSMGPRPPPNVWPVSGTVAIQDLACTTIHEPYITIVENLCQAYAERRKPRNGVKALGLAAGLFAGLSAPAAGAKLSVAELTEMERLLARLNFDPGQIDGVVDEWTRTAVRLYQEFAALPVDGVPSPVLLAELRQVTQAFLDLNIVTTPPATEGAGSQRLETSAIAPSKDTTPPTTERDGPRLSEAPRAAPSSSISMPSTAGVRTQREENLVLLIQRGLKDKGFDPGPRDGLMGPRTRGAIETYQQRYNLTAHGQPTKSLLDHLRREPRGQDKWKTAGTGIQFVKAPAVTAAGPSKGAVMKMQELAPSEPTALRAQAALGAASAGFGVELSSLGSADEAMRKRRQLQQAFPDLLGDKDLVIERVDVGERGIFYRVRTQASQDRLTADYMCAQFRARKRRCQVVLLRSTAQAITIAKTTPSAFTNGSGTQSSITSRDGLSYAQAGVDAQNEGNYGKAIEFYTFAIESGDLSREDLARVFSNRGSVHRNTGVYDLAIDDYNTAISLKKEYARAYYNRAITYGSKGLIDLAIEDYSTAIRLKPNYVNAYNNRGLTYKNNGLYDQAIADFSQAIRLAPDFDYAYFNRGDTYEINGERQRAVKDFMKSYALKSDDRAYQAKMRELGLLQ